MTIPKIIFRNLMFYRRIHIWVVLGTMVSTAILVGALVIGDSIQYSLRQIVLNRLGTIQFALSSDSRFFRTQTAQKLSGKLGVTVAPILATKGIAITGGGKERLNAVRIYGVDNRFGDIGGVPALFDNISPDEALINTQTALRLGLKEGDEFLLRLETLDFIPKDVPLVPDSKSGTVKRFTVKHIVSTEEFGGFNLNADQITPGNVFVSLDFLGREMEVENRSNVLLVGGGENPLSADSVNAAFKEIWTLTDTGFELNRTAETSEIELTSDRIFLDPAVTNETQKLFKNAQRIFTYFVNEIRLGERTTPYSFAAGISDLDINENEILINEWLADDLGTREGDSITLTYYVLGQSRTLVEETADFRVKSIVPMKGIYADRTLMPDFPGLSDAENSRDWDPGIPIDLGKIRDKDEEYWDTYRGTPKVFLSLGAAQKMWQNRFGTVTAIRFRDETPESIERTLTGAVDPASLGFFFRDVKSEGFRASMQSQDFGQLFLGLSFFIIVAALLLTGLLYVFNIEQRSEETGLFLALGFSAKSVKRLILFEGAILVVIGSILGVLCGIVYNQIVLAALRTVWQDIVGTSSIEIHILPLTLLFGTLIGIIVNLLTIRLVAGSQLKQPITDLQKGITKLSLIKSRKTGMSLAFGILCLIGVFVILIFSNAGNGDSFAFFFSAGTLLLIGGVAFGNFFIVKQVDTVRNITLNLTNLGIRNIVRKRFRSLAIIGLLASGIFIVFTVGANRRSTLGDAENRESGTGGFALFMESVMPIIYDLNSDTGRDYYGLEELDTGDVSFVSFRVKEGDDASCLNLNRVSTPQLIGVNPEELSNRNAFSFVKTSGEVNPEQPWDVLDKYGSGDVIPGIADETVIVWGLGKSVGDTLNYTDETGGTYKIRLVGGLANSVFQGNIIISEKAFLAKYPSVSGSKLFLVDAPFAKINTITQIINRALQDQGVETIPTYERLAQFSQVENTYLSIFLILGTFGLIIGSIGISIVIARNVSEREGELALLYSAGFEKKAIRMLILSEHSILLFAGIIIGILSALLAALPALTQPGSNIPYSIILIAVCFVTLNGIFWTYSAASMAIRKDLIPALRNE
ncbi:FtsX-like permease family protein [Candidatus Latescibacterota bacterium]